MTSHAPSLPDRHDHALFLDFDGTLVDIAPTPTSVEVPNGLPNLLARLKRALGGAMAIITGRPIAEIDRLLGVLDASIAGVHGAQMRLGPEAAVTTEAAPIEQDAIKTLHMAICAFDGAWVEEKGSAVAVHYRAAAPEMVSEIERRLNHALAPYSDRLIISPGRKVFEVVPKAMSKGVALTSLMTRPPFAGRLPIMIGDDHSDESAMAAAVRLGGFGLRVGGEHFARETADFRNPSAVRAWLIQIVGGAKV